MNIRNDEAKVYIFAGVARSGKDTSADYMKELLEKEGRKVIKLQFSSYIKMYAKEITSWDGSEETKPRELLQTIGTDIIRNKIDYYFFIKRIIDDIKVYSYFFDTILISDARLKEEITTIKENFKYVKSIFVDRPSFDNNLTDEEKEHITETGLEGYNDYDYTLINDSTIDALKEKVNKIVKEEM